MSERGPSRGNDLSRQQPGHSPWVVKLGGSLADSPFLRPWLNAIAEGGGRLIVVPGGGPFADAVRSAQSTQGFDDATAHRMALLGMEQYAAMLSGLERALHSVDTLDAILDALGRELVPLWLPARTVLARADIEASWDVTSDSLAAWLAGEVGAAALILVKAMSIDAACTAAALAGAGIVDRAFPSYLARCGCACSIVGAAEHAHFRRALRDGPPAGMPVL